MITPENGIQSSGGFYAAPVTYYGLSTDTKPVTGVANGSAFIEMDTSKRYFFDAANATWREWGGA